VRKPEERIARVRMRSAAASVGRALVIAHASRSRRRIEGSIRRRNIGPGLSE
jgi:hypothetical protein